MTQSALTVDHLVIRVRDLDATVDDLSALGFTVQHGGTHADGVTHNALIGFADGSYIELIAFLRPAPQRRWWSIGEQHGDGFVDFALLPGPGSVAATIEAARVRGLSYDGPQDGGRMRPDGERLAWQTGRPATADLPFLCGDITPRRLRVPEGEVRHHANGVRGIASLAVAVRDLDVSTRRYAALLGIDTPVLSAPLAGFGARATTFRVGATALVLFEAAASASSDSALRRQLDTRGEGLFGIALDVGHDGDARVLDANRTHGAHIETIRTFKAGGGRA
ncbi:VOC family protein [Paraburkholderia acidicola]|uniref:VOC family protein n=1 Tax=Paraburkholderia acidicola TaxID=1912599 RepID=A0ABV1LTX5_9BURK